MLLLQVNGFRFEAWCCCVGEMEKEMDKEDWEH